jgi:putative Holliday junction resolvase
VHIETYLGFDVGTKRTGVAIANSLTQMANGIEVVTHHKNGATNWQGFDDLIQAHQPNTLIVGLPLKENGQDQMMSFIVKSFAKKLQIRYELSVTLVDEYLSSIDAKKNLKYNHFHKNANRGEVDKASAQIILQTWLNESYR